MWDSRSLLPPHFARRMALFLAAAAVLLSFRACATHRHDHDAHIVAFTRICETTEPRPGMFVRISRFSTNQFFSHSPWVLSICNDHGGCNAKAWFEGPYAPNVRPTPNGGLQIEIAGIAHQVFPDHPLTRPVGVQFTNTIGVDARQMEKRFKYLDCPDPALPNHRKPVV